MKEDLLRLFEETPGETAQGTSGKIIILKVKTHFKMKDKIVYVFCCRGHRKITTDPDFLFKDRSIQEIGNIFHVFRLVEKIDDGRMTAWLKATWHDRRI